MADESRKSVLLDVLAHAKALEADVDRMMPWQMDDAEEFKQLTRLKIALICLKMKTQIDLLEEEQKRSGK